MQFASSCPSLFQRWSESNKSKSDLAGPESIFHFPKESFNPSNFLFKGGSKLLVGKLAKTVWTAEEMLGGWGWETEIFSGFLLLFQNLGSAQVEHKLLPSSQKNKMPTSAPVPCTYTGWTEHLCPAVSTPQRSDAISQSCLPFTQGAMKFWIQN